MVDLEKSDQISYSVWLKGLSKETVIWISQDLNEPDWMLDFRLKSFEIFKKIKKTDFWPDLSSLNYDDLVYYAVPERDYQWSVESWEQVPEKIRNIYDKLKIPESEKKYLAGVGGQYDSSVVYHKLKEKWEKAGIIFLDMSEAVKTHSELVKKYFMKLVSPDNHRFAALHGAVWSGGTFIYVPKGVKLTDPLQAYFRMNTLAGGQFEHTLIVLEDEAEASYIEWCSAPKYDQRSLHAWCVEIFVWKNAKMRYSSVENWSFNTFNLNTKRAIVGDNSFMERISGNLGSGATMLYPCSILQWKNAKSDNISLVVASENQYQDIWAKVIHIWENTSSNIVSKSISKDGWKNIYRWLVDVKKSAKWAVCSVKCDALMIDEKSVSETIPNMQVETDDATISHEATAWKIDTYQLFYLMSKWLKSEKAMAMLVNGFLSWITKQLPMEYAGELNHLIEMEMEGF